MKEVKITKYVANNGVQFDTKEDCIKYEEIIKNMKYYIISYCPDTNEEVFQKHKLLIVNSNGAQNEIAYAAALELCDGKIIKSGYGNKYLPNFKIKEVSVEEFNELKGERYIDKNIGFVSNEEVIGFPAYPYSISNFL